eukprot:gene6074-148_t
MSSSEDTSASSVFDSTSSSSDDTDLRPVRRQPTRTAKTKTVEALFDTPTSEDEQITLPWHVDLVLATYVVFPNELTEYTCFMMARPTRAAKAAGFAKQSTLAKSSPSQADRHASSSEEDRPIRIRRRRTKGPQASDTSHVTKQLAEEACPSNLTPFQLCKSRENPHDMLFCAQCQESFHTSCIEGNKLLCDVTSKLSSGSENDSDSDSDLFAPTAPAKGKGNTQCRRGGVRAARLKAQTMVESSDSQQKMQSTAQATSDEGSTSSSTEETLCQKCERAIKSGSKFETCGQCGSSFHPPCSKHSRSNTGGPRYYCKRCFDTHAVPMSELPCQVCNDPRDPDSTILCDKCDACYHLECLKKGIGTVLPAKVGPMQFKLAILKKKKIYECPVFLLDLLDAWKGALSQRGPGLRKSWQGRSGQLFGQQSSVIWCLVHFTGVINKPGTMDQEELFLTKWDDIPYRRAQWVGWQEFEAVGQARRPANFLDKMRRGDLDEAGNFGSDHYNPLYNQVDRIINYSEKHDAYFVKWCGLPYDQCTWEAKVDLSSELSKIAEYEMRNRRPHVRPNARATRPVIAGEAGRRELHDKLCTHVFNNSLKLRNYQVEGVEWLLWSWCNRRNVMLGDEMGLGKTAQSSCFIEFLRTGLPIDHRRRGPFLVVAPLSVLENWSREIAMWTTMNCIGMRNSSNRLLMNPLVWHGNETSRQICHDNEWYYTENDGAGRRKFVPHVLKFDVLVTNYQNITNASSHALLSRVPWQVLIVDEGHCLKGQGLLSDRLTAMNIQHRVILTGTPVQNNIEELCNLLMFLEADIPNKEDFMHRFGNMKTKESLQELHDMLRPYLLRRVKEDVEHSIPPKRETVIRIKLTSVQRAHYRAVLENNRAFLAGSSGKAAIHYSLNNIMMVLRKLCNHPFLVDGIEERTQQVTPFAASALLPITTCGKMIFLDKFLDRMRKQGERVLIFTQFVGILDILQEYCKARKWPCERIDGGVQGLERQRAVDRFNASDQDGFVFILSTRAGGVGLNLTSATKVIIYDSDWNPQNDLQAQSRCHRIGQTQEVTVYRILTEHTVEERMFDSASRKLGLTRAVLAAESDTLSAPTKRKGKMMGGLFSDEEVLRLLRHGAYELFQEEDKDHDDIIMEENIDSILDRATQVVHDGSCDAEGTQGPSSFAQVKYVRAEGVDEGDELFWDKVLPEVVTCEKVEALLDSLSSDQEADVLDHVKEIMQHFASLVDQQKAIQVGTAEHQHLTDALSGVLLAASLNPQVPEQDRQQASAWRNEVEAPLRRRTRAVVSLEDLSGIHPPVPNQWDDDAIEVVAKTSAACGFWDWERLSNCTQYSFSRPADPEQLRCVSEQLLCETVAMCWPSACQAKPKSGKTTMAKDGTQPRVIPPNDDDVYDDLFDELENCKTKGNPGRKKGQKFDILSDPGAARIPVTILQHVFRSMVCGARRNARQWVQYPSVELEPVQVDMQVCEVTPSGDIVPLADHKSRQCMAGQHIVLRLSLSIRHSIKDAVASSPSKSLHDAPDVIPSVFVALVHGSILPSDLHELKLGACVPLAKGPCIVRSQVLAPSGVSHDFSVAVPGFTGKYTVVAIPVYPAHSPPAGVSLCTLSVDSVLSRTPSASIVSRPRPVIDTSSVSLFLKQCKKHKTHLLTSVNYLFDRYPDLELPRTHLTRILSLHRPAHLPDWYQIPNHDIALLKGLRTNGWSDQGVALTLADPELLDYEAEKALLPKLVKSLKVRLAGLVMVLTPSLHIAGFLSVGHIKGSKGWCHHASSSDDTKDHNAVAPFCKLTTGVKQTQKKSKQTTLHDFGTQAQEVGGATPPGFSQHHVIVDESENATHSRLVPATRKLIKEKKRKKEKEKKTKKEKKEKKEKKDIKEATNCKKVGVDNQDIYMREMFYKTASDSIRDHAHQEMSGTNDPGKEAPRIPVPMIPKKESRQPTPPPVDSDVCLAGRAESTEQSVPLDHSPALHICSSGHPVAKKRALDVASGSIHRYLTSGRQAVQTSSSQDCLRSPASGPRSPSLYSSRIAPMGSGAALISPTKPHCDAQQTITDSPAQAHHVDQLLFRAFQDTFGGLAQNLSEEDVAPQEVRELSMIIKEHFWGLLEKQKDPLLLPVVASEVVVDPEILKRQHNVPTWWSSLHDFQLIKDYFLVTQLDALLQTAAACASV